MASPAQTYQSKCLSTATELQFQSSSLVLSIFFQYPFPESSTSSKSKDQHLSSVRSGTFQHQFEFNNTTCKVVVLSIPLRILMRCYCNSFEDQSFHVKQPYFLDEAAILIIFRHPQNYCIILVVTLTQVPITTWPFSSLLLNSGPLILHFVMHMDAEFAFLTVISNDQKSPIFIDKVCLPLNISWKSFC